MVNKHGFVRLYFYIKIWDESGRAPKNKKGENLK